MPAGDEIRANLPFDGRCPNCRKDGWTAAPTGVVAGLTVRPFVCNTCGYVALMRIEDE